MQRTGEKAVITDKCFVLVKLFFARKDVTLTHVQENLEGGKHFPVLCSCATKHDPRSYSYRC